MKEILLNTSEKTSRILVGESFRNIGNYLPRKQLVVITDENVARHYEGFFPEGLKIIVKPGESSKSLDSASGIYGELIRNEVDRQSFILGVGGGIVCDLAGYIASTYLRGVSFGFVSTTLLGQVDASIGGKNGVNYEGYKNMVGIIRQPDFVICDPVMLETLEPSEFRMGFAEVIKYGAIMDRELFGFLEGNYRQALEMDPIVLEEIIALCAASKSDIVSRDEKESGERIKLNFGHTFAHAFEKVDGMPHGEAVAIGMVLAARLSEKIGILDMGEAAKLEDLIRLYGLPVNWEGSCAEAFEIMKNDKKRDGDSIRLILLESIGKAVVREIPISELKNWTDDLC